MGDRAACVSSLCIQIFLKQLSLFWLKPRYFWSSSILVFPAIPGPKEMGSPKLDANLAAILKTSFVFPPAQEEGMSCLHVAVRSCDTP